MIRVEKLSKTYDRRSLRANRVLSGVSFQLPDTGFVCIVGPSGCGKTSLLNAVGGLDVFDEGRVSTDTLGAVRCGSRETDAERNRSFGYIFQNYYLLPEHTVAYNVYLGLHSLELTHEEKLRRVMQALRDVDMARFARRKAGELSGGQQQRVSIARALARRPRVIFADEPTGNLDRANTIHICTLLRRISKTSLVVMVTHEEDIARFFADRILTIENGCLAGDETGWQREGLAFENDRLYAGDYESRACRTDGVELRLLRESDAAPVALTVVALKDRVLVKLDDSRAVSCSGAAESPVLVEGRRPVLRLEELEQEELHPEPPAPQGRAGSGLGLGMMLREAASLVREKGLRRAGTWAFLVVLTVLTMLTVGDYLNVASMDPEDFVTTDSHVLEIQIERGANVGTDTLGIQSLVYEYLDHLDASGLAFTYLPNVPVELTYSEVLFRQMGAVEEKLYGFSYVPIQALDGSTILYGRAPENPEEIVIDRWVLDALLAKDGILQSGISDVSDFLGAELSYSRKNYAPTIVGICDSGEPAVYMDLAGLASVGTAGTEVIRLSDLQAAFPGVYEDVTLSAGECLIVTNNAGQAYADRVGGVYTTNSKVSYTIAGTIEADTYASLVIADEALEELLRSMLLTRFYVYCGDKQAVMDYLSAGMDETLSGRVQAHVRDYSSEAWQSYRSATQLRLDGRTIVTVTVMLVSLVMLCLLQRSRVRERLGMISVYRLLGIPGRKLAAIFAMESVLTGLRSVLPAGVLTWLAVTVLGSFASLEVQLSLPWQAAALTALVIFAFHLAVSVLSLLGLLRLPPARLAAKFDF